MYIFKVLNKVLETIALGSFSLASVEWQTLHQPSSAIFQAFEGGAPGHLHEDTLFLLISVWWCERGGQITRYLCQVPQ